MEMRDKVNGAVRNDPDLLWLKQCATLSISGEQTLDVRSTVGRRS